MKIYRILAEPEYKSFLEQHSILNPNQRWKFQRTHMIFPENFDKFGKFFFFELEDAFQFARFYESCTTKDMILELDIDSETALKYLSVAQYRYPDPAKNKHGYADHNIPELYLEHGFVDEKIKRNEYRLINPMLELKGFPKIYEGNRTPKIVELGNVLNKIIQLKPTLSNNTIWSFQISEYKELGITEFQNEKTDVDLTISREKAESLKNQLESVAKGKFLEFVREHDKYMVLVPVNERQLV